MEVLLGRKNFLNRNFEWSETNIQKIMDVNAWLWKRTDELKHYMKELSSPFKKLAQTDSDFAEFNIRGQIEYYGSEPTDIATMELQREMSKNADFHLWSLRRQRKSEIPHMSTMMILTGILRFSGSI